MRPVRSVVALLFVPVLFAGPCGNMVGFRLTPAPAAVPADSLAQAASAFVAQFAEQTGLPVAASATESSGRTWDACAGGPAHPLSLCWRVRQGQVEFQTIEWLGRGRAGKKIRRALTDSLHARFGPAIEACEWHAGIHRDNSGRRRDTATCKP